MGAMIGFQAYLQASGYYSSEFQKNNFIESTFENDFVFIFFTCNLLGLIVTTKYGKIIDGYTLTYAFLVSGICLLWAALLCYYGVSSYSLFTMACAQIFIIGISVAFIKAGLFGLANYFPQMYTGAIMSGEAIAGVIVTVLRITTLLSGPPDPNFCTNSDTTKNMMFLDHDIASLNNGKSGILGNTETGSNLFNPDIAAATTVNGEEIDMSKHLSELLHQAKIFLESIDYSTVFFFTVAAVISFSCILVYLFLANLPFTIQFKDQDSRREEEESLIPIDLDTMETTSLASQDHGQSAAATRTHKDKIKLAAPKKVARTLFKVV